MPEQNGPRLPDDALDRLARAWFAEMRTQSFQKPLSKPAGDATGDVGADLLEWLLDAGDDAGDGDSGD